MFNFEVISICVLNNVCAELQIDGSTLKTLCVQHGPLQNFHLYLNHGIALAKYSTRDEANKVSTLSAQLHHSIISLREIHRLITE